MSEKEKEMEKQADELDAMGEDSTRVRSELDAEEGRNSDARNS